MNDRRHNGRKPRKLDLVSEGLKSVGFVVELDLASWLDESKAKSQAKACTDIDESVIRVLRNGKHFDLGKQNRSSHPFRDCEDLREAGVDSIITRESRRFLIIHSSL